MSLSLVENFAGKPRLLPVVFEIVRPGNRLRPKFFSYRPFLESHWNTKPVVDGEARLSQHMPPRHRKPCCNNARGEHNALWQSPIEDWCLRLRIRECANPSRSKSSI